MADEDEIDVLGDFSFNSCFAQNSQGIPSCSNREDTVHPQWLLDSTATNWYDIQNKGSHREGTKTTSSSSLERDTTDIYTAWTAAERDTLEKEMAKYGRNISKISQTLKTKTEVEIQALIDAEYGILLDTPTFVLESEEPDGVPSVVQEEIVTDDTPNIIDAIEPNAKLKIPKKKYIKSKNSLLKPDVLHNAKIDTVDIDPKEIFYEDDLMLGSTESIGSDMDLTDIVSKNIEKYQKVKVGKKMGNHRRKISGSDKNKQRNKSKDLIKSPQGRQRKDSNLSEDNTKSPRMQIILGSGQALPLSEGEQVIKIEKKKDSDPESDIEVDIDSDNDNSIKNTTKTDETESKLVDEAPIAVPLSNFEPMPKRQKKIMNLAGDGGYTIMHTEAGDLVAVGTEPRRRPRRPPRPQQQPIPLLPCRVYNADKPAPFRVRMYVSALISMDAHAHTSRAEVMGLLGAAPPAPAAPVPPADDALHTVTVVSYRPAAASAELTHCDMDPVSAAAAAAALGAGGGGGAAGWHHSHPRWAAAPSARDLNTQRRLQRALERGPPFLALITSQHWPVGRTASHYRCIRVEEDEGDENNPVGYQLSVKLVPDLTLDNLPAYLEEIITILCYETDTSPSQYMVDLANDICPQAKMSYLEKCISSISHHMRSAGYDDEDPVVTRLIQGIRDIFR